jgi:hypothetical protein
VKLPKSHDKSTSYRTEFLVNRYVCSRWGVSCRHIAFRMVASSADSAHAATQAFPSAAAPWSFPQKDFGIIWPESLIVQSVCRSVVGRQRHKSALPVVYWFAAGRGLGHDEVTGPAWPTLRVGVRRYPHGVASLLQGFGLSITRLLLETALSIGSAVLKTCDLVAD